jgi:hypothetical protein
MSEIVKIQALDVQGAANILTEYTDRLAKAQEAFKSLSGLEYNAENKPKFDGFVAAVKSRSNELETKRKPFTSELNAVVKLFTAAEKGFLELAEPFVEKEKAWKRAELLKQQEAQAAQQKAADKIRLVAAFVPKVESMLLDLIHQAKVDYIDFLSTGEDPVLFEMTDDTWKGLCKSAMLALGAAEFGVELAAAIAPQKAELIGKTNQDVQAFQSEADKHKGNKKALQALGRTLGVSYQEAVIQAADNADAAKVEAEMAIAETAQIEMPAVAIGTKFIPTPTNHKEVLEIFRQWIANENPTVEDACAQIGKAMTYCKRQALKGTKFGGVTYIEDVK